LATTAMGWETDFHQLDLGQGCSRLRAAATDKVVLMRVDFSNRMHQRANLVAGCQTFGVLAGPQKSGRIASRVLDSDSLLFMDPRSGLDAVVESSFAAYTFSVSNDCLQQLAEVYELPDPVSRAARPGSERAIPVGQLTAIRSSLEEALQQSEANLATEQTRKLLESELPGLVLRSWFGANDRPSPQPRNRTRVLRKALDYIAAFPGEPLTVEQLCVASAGSMSTLERAFAEHFGVSPKRYLMLSRFSGVHRALLDISSISSITTVANEWGFWHMGKFAADYRKIYGQLPSQTRLP
jgi:AraC family ethanolamine operon transcriptional activator